MNTLPDEYAEIKAQYFLPGLRRGPAAGRGETVHFGSFLKRVTGGIPGTWLYACGGGQ